MTTSSARTPSAPPPSAKAQRARFALLSLTILVASAICFVSLDRIGAVTRRRFDVTATGEHRLSPRTAGVLDALPPGCRLLIAMDRRTLEPGARAMINDVLDEFDRATDRLSTDWIDTGSDAGRLSLDRALRALTKDQAAPIEAYRSTLSSAAAAIATACTAVETSIAPALDAVRDTLPESDPSRVAFQERAALLRVLARDGAGAASALDSATIPADPAGSPVPIYDVAWRAAQPIAQNLDAQLDALARELGEYARSALGVPAARDAAGGLSRTAAAVRDPLARAIDAARTQPTPGVIRVARVIEADRAALVVGPGAAGVVAIDLDALVAAAAAPAAEARGRVESLLGTALGTLLNPDPPIVVLVHAESPALLARAALYERLAQHLSVRGIDLVMWPIVASEREPALREIDPDGRRPVVYVILSTDSGAQGRGSGVLPGIERAQRLGRVCQDLFERGASMLISVSPSVVPATGSPDPTVSFLREIGLECDTAHPIVHEQITQAGRMVTTPIAAVALTPATPTQSHPIAGAIRGLPLFMAWPIRLSISTPPPGVEIAPLLTHADPSMWGESQWLGLWQVAMENQASVSSPPTRDARDLDLAGTEPVLLACAIERASAGATDQRLVVVGTHSYGQYGWLADPITHDQNIVDGRPIRSHPGNLELLDASISYLAGLDDLIAQGPEAGDSPKIRDIAPGTLWKLRIALGIGLPASVLACAVLVAIIRR